MTTKKYRPSNGSEGMCFVLRWCEHCQRHTEQQPCHILFDTMVYDTTDDEYPEQWQYKDNQPVCTAFMEIDNEQ